MQDEYRGISMGNVEKIVNCQTRSVNIHSKFRLKIIPEHLRRWSGIIWDGRGYVFISARQETSSGE